MFKKLKKIFESRRKKIVKSYVITSQHKCACYVESPKNAICYFCSDSLHCAIHYDDETNCSYIKIISNDLFTIDIYNRDEILKKLGLSKIKEQE